MKASKSSAPFGVSRDRQKKLAVAGGMLIHLTLGSFYTLGNMTNYIASYMRYAGQTDVRLKDTTFILSALFLGQCIAMPLGGQLNNRLGPKLTCILGATIMCGGIGAGGSLLWNYGWFIFCYGFLYGFGLGLAYSSPIICALKWYPRQRGMASGLITAGFGAGALIFNQVQTRLINPFNMAPSDRPYFVSAPSEAYFDDVSVLENVPGTFSSLAVVYFILQLIGVSCLSEPEETEQVEKNEKSKNKPSLFKSLKNSRFLLILSLFLLNGFAISFTASAWKQLGIATSHNNQPPQYYDQNHQQNTQRNDINNTPINNTPINSNPINNTNNTNNTNHLNDDNPINNNQPINNTPTQNNPPLSDKHLALIGSVASICNAAGRILWGSLADHTSTRYALMWLSSLWSILLIMLPLGIEWSTTAYIVIVCLNFFCLGGNFSIFPTLTATAFGPEMFGSIYGFVYASQLFASVTVAFVTRYFMGSLGSQGLAIVFALGCLLCVGVCSLLPRYGVNLGKPVSH